MHICKHIIIHIYTQVTLLAQHMNYYNCGCKASFVEMKRKRRDQKKG